MLLKRQTLKTILLEAITSRGEWEAEMQFGEQSQELKEMHDLLTAMRNGEIIEVEDDRFHLPRYAHG